ncbi:MAG: F0F1 ATP synthase subunit B [Planctomycetota bacterium]
MSFQPVLAAGGFDPLEFTTGAAFWTIVVFLLAMVPMWKFVFGPITKALEETDKKVEDAKAAADQARADAQAQAEATTQELEKARAEAKQMVQEATARAERQGQEELNKARAEAERQLTNARQEIEAQKQRALEEIRKEVVDLAIGGAGQILRSEVNGDAQRKLVDQFLTEQSASGSGASN